MKNTDVAEKGAIANWQHCADSPLGWREEIALISSSRVFYLETAAKAQEQSNAY